MTRTETNKLAGHILDDIGESICDLSHDDADAVIDEVVARLNRPATRTMILPDERPEHDFDELDHGCLTAAERQR